MCIGRVHCGQDVCSVDTIPVGMDSSIPLIDQTGRRPSREDDAPRTHASVERRENRKRPAEGTWRQTRHKSKQPVETAPMDPSTRVASRRERNGTKNTLME